MRIWVGIIILISALLITGCSSVPIEIKHFVPVLNLPAVHRSVKYGDEGVEFESKDYHISAVLFESNNIIVLPLSIQNRTAAAIDAGQYSVQLFDGRDFKPVKLISRDDLVKVRANYEGASQSLGSEQQVLTAALTAVANTISPSSKSYIMEGMDHAIDNYFQFRPIYALETREGILCFLVDFGLEYPLNLKIKIRDRDIDLFFMPKPEEKKD
ncbi:MAG: hypothetical protein KJ732_07425 [Candidatus Margulisbacteria bacterium]|nr:hypothetical protein [Candidatus Margulisiibacteriota bacterium]